MSSVSPLESAKASITKRFDDYVGAMGIPAGALTIPGVSDLIQRAVSHGVKWSACHMECGRNLWILENVGHNYTVMASYKTRSSDQDGRPKWNTMTRTSEWIPREWWDGESTFNNLSAWVSGELSSLAGSARKTSNEKEKPSAEAAQEFGDAMPREWKCMAAKLVKDLTVGTIQAPTAAQASQRPRGNEGPDAGSDCANDLQSDNGRFKDRDMAEGTIDDSPSTDLSAMMSPQTRAGSSPATLPAGETTTDDTTPLHREETPKETLPSDQDQHKEEGLSEMGDPWVLIGGEGDA